MSVSKDLEEAVKWFRKAAEQGDMEAQYNLGLCYEQSEGVANDLKEAVKWYRQSAEQGYALGQFNLGICYINGDGVSKDSDEAVKWIVKAAEQGLVNAIETLRELGFDVKIESR
jgi:TPR repeat protein